MEPNDMMPLPDVNKMLRHPQKGDLFVPSPAAIDRYRGDPAYACAIGYRMAAQLAVEHVRQGAHESFLFYPIVFLYRHHVELMLKKLILAFGDAGVRRITHAEHLGQPALKSLEKGKKAHSLQWLWDRLRPMVQALGNSVVPSEEIAGINSYIRQLNGIDPDSVGFRYTAAIQETKAKLGKAQKHGAEVDIRMFAEAMERLANFLDGLDSYVDFMIECDHEVMSDS
jgi:hypothetical protein